MNAPHVFLLHDWLDGEAHESYERPNAPLRGTWVIVGYGRFGKTIRRRLEGEGLKTIVNELHPHEDAPQDLVIGEGTDAGSLNRAGIKDAVGVIAGTDDDVNNLSIIMTAREINPEVYTVARQNNESNELLFNTLHADLVMNPHRVLAAHIRCMLTSPRLAQYFEITKTCSKSWGWLQIDRLYEIVDNSTVPDVWSMCINRQETPALTEAINAGQKFTLDDLTRDSYGKLNALVLMVWQDDKEICSPSGELQIGVDDVILFCGDEYAYHNTRRNLRDKKTLDFLKSGHVEASGYVLRWIERSRSKSNAEENKITRATDL